MKKLFGFKSILIFSMGLILVAALVLISYLSIVQLEGVVTDNVIVKINSSAEYESKRIETYIEQTTHPIVELSKLYDKYKYQDKHEKIVEFAAMVSPASKITLGMDDGSSFVSKPSEQTFPGGIGIKEKYDPRKRPWYSLAKNNPGLSLTNVFFTSTQIPITLAVFPIEGGVLAADVRLSNLQEIVEGIKIMPDMKSMIVDNNGLVLASTFPSVAAQAKITENEQFSNVYSSILSSDKFDTELDIEGESSLLFSSRINLVDGNGWFLINAVDKQTAMTQVIDASQGLLLVCLVIMAVSAIAMVVVLNQVYRPVLALKSLVGQLASGNGDLTKRLDVKSNDDLGDIARSINAFIENLNEMMLKVKRSAILLSDDIVKLRDNTSKNTSILEQHQSETNQVVVAMGQLGASSEQVATSAQDAAQFITEANSSVVKSKQNIENTQQSLSMLASEVDGATDKVNQMSNETKGISSILTVIGDIAEQTNLLALNAAIEAARAGEQGRGFAVVADEVRALAARTQQSTGEIDASLSQLQSGANSVVESIENTKDKSEKTVGEAVLIAESLESMVGYVTEINNISSQISDSANEQNGVIHEIGNNMNRINEMVEALSNNGHVIRDETDKIAHVNEQLRAIVSEFKLQE